MARLIESIAAFTLVPVAGSSNPDIPVSQRQMGQSLNSKRITFDPGIYQIMVDWDGPEQVNLSLSRDTASPAWEQILSIPAGTGARTAMRKIVVSQNAQILPVIVAQTEATITSKKSLGISVIRIGE